jgi:undecaprenyl diphosphate synthase
MDHTETDVDSLSADKLPRHVAIIMDGNGRWAEQRHLPRIAGHRRGVEAVREAVKECAKRGIGVLTLFAFSSENWQRPPQEVGLLMELFITSLRRETKMLQENHIQLRVIGERSALNDKLQQEIASVEAVTRANDRLVLVVAANYGGRWDITQATRKLAWQARLGKIDPDEITPAHLEAHLSLRGLPEPDLFIRTSGEQRLSNFLLWQLAYTELYFTEVLWPDFDSAALNAALASYASRQRRFGHTREQVEQPQGA